jgi:hypothetical protein
LDHQTKTFEDKIKHLAQSLKCGRFCGYFISTTQVETFEDAKNFFRPSLDHLHDPYLMKTWKSGGSIELAIENQENILVLVIMMSMERPLSPSVVYLKPIILMLPPIFQIADEGIWDFI